MTMARKKKEGEAEVIETPAEPYELSKEEQMKDEGSAYNKLA